MVKKRNSSAGKKNAQASKKAVSRLYTMLPKDAEMIEDLRFRYQKEALARTSKPADVAKSEIIRAGIHILNRMSNDQLYKAVEQVEELQEGRPPKNHSFKG